MEPKKAYFKKCIVVLAGPPLTGKSTLGKELAKRTNFIFLDVDEIRQKLFPADHPLPSEQEKNIMETSYKENHRLAKKWLAMGKPVILAATYAREFYHQQLKELSQNTKASLIVFQLAAPIPEIKLRLYKRQQVESFSNIHSLEGYLEVKNRYQTMKNVHLVALSTNQPLETTLEQVLQNLESFKQFIDQAQPML